MDIRNIHLLTRSPLWAIKSEAVLDAIARVTAVRVAGEWEAAKPSVQGKGSNKIAVIPIEGVLTKDGPSYYGTSYDTITSALESASADPAIKRVVLAVDSPGGEVTGLPETAAVLASVAKDKPVSAIVLGTSASAAYWLTSQAHDVTLTPSGEVGSVGVRMMHVDVSRMMDAMGYKITELHAGDFKTEWSPYKPLSEEAKTDMQTRLNAMHQDFINAVATGRGARASADIVQKRFGEGRMFGSSAAMSNGLVDKIQSAREFYRAVAPPQEETPSFGLPRAQLAIARQRV
jgi:signal peptide peptidase SppA